MSGARETLGLAAFVVLALGMSAYWVGLLRLYGFVFARKGTGLTFGQAQLWILQGRLPEFPSARMFRGSVWAIVLGWALGLSSWLLGVS